MNLGRALLLVLLLASCASDAGWSRGKKYFLLEVPELQVRRAPQKIDKATGELVLAWVAVRAPTGHARITGCELTIFHDADRDGVPAPAEVVEQRSSFDRAEKVTFADLRLPYDATRRLSALMAVRTEEGAQQVRWKLEPD
jgi:hypothetical protein